MYEILTRLGLLRFVSTGNSATPTLSSERSTLDQAQFWAELEAVAIYLHKNLLNINNCTMQVHQLQNYL
jgi:hypothetical protein